MNWAAGSRTKERGNTQLNRDYPTSISIGKSMGWKIPWVTHSDGTAREAQKKKKQNMGEKHLGRKKAGVMDQRLENRKTRR